MDPQWPDGVTLVTIRHRPVTTGGRTLAGNMVTAVASERLWTDDGSILPAEASTRIAADGSWEITLPAVDEGVRPAGAAYRLTEHVPGVSGKPLWVAPMSHHAPGPVDLVDILTPRPAPGGGITIQTGPATDPSMAAIAGDPDSEFRGALTDVIAPVAVPAAEQAAATYLASEPAVTDAAALAAAQAIDDQGGITDPVIAAALADPTSASHQLAVPRGEVVVIDTDHPTLEAALTATAEGGTLEVRRQYTRSTPWTIDRPVTVRFARGGSVTTSTGVGITVAASGVTIDDPHLVGAGSGAGGSADAIRAVGTAAAPVDRLTINRPQLSGWPRCGIYTELVRGLRVTDVDIEDVGYAGVLALSTRGGFIRGGTISDVIKASSYTDAYGIALTRESSDSLLDAPRSSDFTVDGVTIDGVEAHEGIDTHGGENLRILDCTVRNTRVGVALVPSNNGSGAATFAPRNILVSGCTIDSTVSDGSRSDGIRVVGAAGERATGVMLTSNRIVDHGDDSTLTTGAILAYNTTGLIISGNIMVRPCVSGVSVNYSNEGMILAGNTVEDAWSDAQGITAAIYSRSTNNDITISGTQIMRGTKSAALVNRFGLHAAAPDSTSIVDAGGNQWANASNSPTVTTLAAMRAGFFGATPIAKPTGVTADAASIRAALIQLGLISA